ncbi:hypothetical protein [Stratiformator vulcanicus]|uniref:Uncharacterized protein n=1 Tax=Stratiformator vulcanicus TaxID=2527980 RepID=A0A517QVT7_9PLAN|nr:hypothetical protein [Stratiformator vulcanicus]QDT35741.1 hypothetical protein Pan189_00940 [Stratiformator vulcanicus]
MTIRLSLLISLLATFNLAPAFALSIGQTWTFGELVEASDEIVICEILDDGSGCILNCQSPHRIRIIQSIKGELAAGEETAAMMWDVQWRGIDRHWDSLDSWDENPIPHQPWRKGSCHLFFLKKREAEDLIRNSERPYVAFVTATGFISLPMDEAEKSPFGDTISDQISDVLSRALAAQNGITNCNFVNAVRLEMLTRDLFAFGSYCDEQPMDLPGLRTAEANECFLPTTFRDKVVPDPLFLWHYRDHPVLRDLAADAIGD